MSGLNKRVAVIGAGSIGERYIRNLWQLGYRDIWVFRQRNLPFRDIAEAQVHVVTDWEQLEAARPYAAFVCTPTAMHLDQTLRLVQQGVHVLVEKPLSHTVDGITALESAIATNGVYVHIGYMMRHHPILRQIKQAIATGAYGRLLSLQSKWGEYLPDWHPWEDYRTSYAARKDMGGGAALTLSHDLDMVNWLAGSPVEKWDILKNVSSPLEVDVESGADVILRYDSGCTASVHLNYYEKEKERFLKLVFEEASLSADFFKPSLDIRQGGEVHTQVFADFDRNDLFLSQIGYFMEKTSSFSPAESLQQIADSRLIITICHA